MYQESQFDPSAESWAGANGLMQVMPATAEDLGIDDTADPEQSLRGGAEYLRQMYEQFEDVVNTDNRIKFAMAAYNCGLGHVRDAQRLADVRGLDRHVWTDNVEIAIRDLSLPKHYSKPFKLPIINLLVFLRHCLSRCQSPVLLKGRLVEGRCSS